MSRLRIEIWDYARMLQVRPDWSELLARSECDQLFLSWEWQTLWWSRYGESRGWSCRTLAVFEGERLVALAPMYLRDAMRRGLKLRTASMIGTSFRDSSVMLSEYLDLIAEPRHAATAARLCIETLSAETDAREIALSYTPEDGLLRAAIREFASIHGGYTRLLDSVCSYQADLGSGFRAYCASLSAGARRSLLGLRSRLSKRGDIRFNDVGAGAVRQTLLQMDELHQRRWGAPLFSATQLAFHVDFAGMMANERKLALSTLSVSGKVVSVLYDVRIAGTQYNLQAGFDPLFEPRVSLGTLHLGFAMETAAGAGVSRYDMLAGGGRKTDYKARFATANRRLGSLQFLFPGGMALLYRIYDGARRALHRSEVTVPRSEAK